MLLMLLVMVVLHGGQVPVVHVEVGEVVEAHQGRVDDGRPVVVAANTSFKVVQHFFTKFDFLSFR